MATDLMATVLGVLLRYVMRLRTEVDLRAGVVLCKRRQLLDNRRGLLLSKSQVGGANAAVGLLKVHIHGRLRDLLSNLLSVGSGKLHCLLLRC